MSLFEFIVGMISVIFALSVAQLLSGVADLLQRGVRERFFLPHGLWVANLFLLTFLHWWSLWTFREISWNFGMFFYSLIGPSLMFFACAMISPKSTMSTDVHVADHFLGIRKWFLSVIALMMILFSLDGPLFGTEQLLNELRAVQMLIAVLAIFGVFSANRRVHASISLAILFCLGAGAVIRFLPGQNPG